MAIEYNGIQHYKWPNFTGQSERDFQEQLFRDRHKIEMCEIRGIFLISVPYTVKHKDIPAYVKCELKKHYDKKF